LVRDIPMLRDATVPLKHLELSRPAQPLNDVAIYPDRN